MSKKDVDKNEATTEEVKGIKVVLQFLKYFMFACSAGIIQIGSFTLMNEVLVKTDFIQNAIANNEAFGKIMQNEYGPIYLISLILSIIWNFTVNRKFTFKSAANVPVAMAKDFGYNLVFTPLSILWGNYLTGHFANVKFIDYIVLAFTMAVNTVTEFLFYKYVVYRGQEGTGVKKDKKEKD